MKRIRLFFLLLFCVFLIFTVYSDDKEESKAFYEQGKLKFNNGDIDGAIEDLEKSYSLDERNFKAKKLLVDALHSKGKQLVESGEFDAAYEVYKQAYKLWPDNSEIREMYKGLQDGSIQEKYTKEVPDLEETGKTGKDEVIDTLNQAEKELTKVIESDKTQNNSGTEKSIVEKELQEELEKQRKLIEQMKRDYAKKEVTDTSGSKQDVDMLEELVLMYKQMLEEKKEAEKSSDNTSILLQEMKEYTSQLEKQQVTPLNLILIAIGSAFGGIIILFVIILFIFKAMSKRRRVRGQKNQRNSNYNQYSTSTLGIGESMDSEPLFIGYNGEKGEPELEEVTEADDDEMYKDLINYERLKKMHNQLKTGNLQWETVRENIDILQKELKAEILRLVEMKIEGGTVVNYSTVFPVLFPFLTSGDDYLNKKSNILAYKLLEKEKEKTRNETQLIAPYQAENSIAIDGKINLSDTKALTSLAEQQNEKEGRQSHSINVAIYARRIGLVLGINNKDLDLLYIAGLVHDFGYHFFEYDFLGRIKENKCISEEDYKKIQQHPTLGIKYFDDKDIELPQQVKDAILYHHERNDGTGYPDNLNNSEIPEFGQIIAVADVFEALTNERAYHERMTINSAAIIMRDMGRRKFNLKYIEALVNFYKKV